MAFRDYRQRISNSAYFPDEGLSAQCIEQRLGIERELLVVRS